MLLNKGNKYVVTYMTPMETNYEMDGIHQSSDNESERY